MNTSMVKAVSRSPCSASSTVTGTPSGVTMVRCWRRVPSRNSVARSWASVIASPPRVSEINQPKNAGGEADGEASGRARNELPASAFQQRRHKQHEDGADRDVAGLATMQGEAFDAGIASRKQQLLGDDETRRGEQRDRGQFGDAVDREPAEEIDGQVAVVVQRQEGPEGESLVDHQHDARDTGREAETKRQQTDGGVVAEQHVGEQAE